MFCKFISFCVYHIIYYTSSKNSDCKLQITAKKNFNLRYFINIFLLIDDDSDTDSPLSWKLE